MKLYVYSTLSSDMNYTNHAQGGADLPQALPPVYVKGGAGVANDRLITPRGVATEITEEQAASLRARPLVQLHEKNGFGQISADDVDPDKAAADMTGRDQSAPIVPQDLPADSQPTGEGVGDAAPAAPEGRKKR